MLLIGALGVLVGGYALLNPLVSMAAFVYLVAFQAILLGVFTIMLGYKVRAVTEREWILYLMGALSVLFGILVFVNPAVGGLSVIWMIAVLGHRPRRAQDLLCVPGEEPAGSIVAQMRPG